ncbi:uncharacterized protein SPPG_01044 [Spizellomyces punctatus DAOM BR117]|uniref:PRISE-like Rossmann-fold domain-containing protein n=1 Tax=Spizellomyces punctatus (strain DAOM BR117) TaxID=645134 RepID=A0A0L0HRT1_SPIPD|nr:uncharacterized protein SPPG_01044 [Spizellomyces punctatus DAOM BR117]KND03569.1 hypothetical protein SPPG_01044 [Spizellomyces punctatus DAOM BR117]|eukprot:XP_016611608.1 hypothetical protein SPPG_01044 [Spizellomyces punctatus DAOM BR117]
MPSAIVFGANGISGTAMLQALVAQEPAQFSKIVAISRRPPQINLDDPRIHFVSIDILNSSLNEIIKKMRDAGTQDASHAFHYTYIAKNDEEELTEVNKELFHKALEATAAVAKDLKCFLLQTGYKYYGVHKGGKYLAPIPFKEDAPRHEGLNFYYVQEDMLKEAAEKHNWKWIVTRPNFIIGVTKGNFMNLAVTLALYAVLRKELGQPFTFPGNQIMYDNIVDHSAAINNARFQLWCGENLEKTGNRAFNIHDGDKIRFRDVWPKIANYFGLSLPSEAEFFTIPKPKPGEIALQLSVEEYAKDKHDLWRKISQKYGLDESAFNYATWDFADFATGRTWPDDGDMSRAREAGWTTTVDSFEMYKEVFEKMKRLQMIPKY